jgi:hypothetical protein
MAKILRGRAAGLKVGVGKTKFTTDFVLNVDSDPFVPGTDGKVRRVCPVPLGERALGFFEDEIDALIEALREWRNGRPLQRQKTPEKLHSGRDAWRERVNKQRAASKSKEAEPA